MANIIRARSKGEGEFTPSGRTLCYACMEKGEHFVFIRGQRKYACTEHFRAWKEYCSGSERARDSILNEE